MMVSFDEKLAVTLLGLCWLIHERGGECSVTTAQMASMSDRLTLVAEMDTSGDLRLALEYDDEFDNEEEV